MKRRGFLLTEMIVAVVLLMALTMLCVKYFSVTATQRKALDQRQTALHEAANIMERLGVKPWDELTAEKLSEISLSPELKSALPEGEIKIELADENAKPTAKRITITIRWQDQSGQWTQPVRLVAWRYRP
jgi:Tfp pilus assembly protein PilE